MKKFEIPTPALVLDFDKLNLNINEMANRINNASINLRPHIKSHKTPIIAHMQLKAGAVGIVCAKLGEAEVMAASGIEDILIAYPIIGEDKIERILNLAHWVPKISIAIDTYKGAYTLNSAAVAREQCIDVIVEIEAGYHRTGIEPNENLLKFVRLITTSLPGLRYKGLMYMAGGSGEFVEKEKQLSCEIAGARIATEAAAFLQANGIKSEVISGGSTPGARFIDKIKGINEYRAGCYVFGDIRYADLGAIDRKQISLTILTSVVSVPDVSEPDHFVVDAGSKTLTHCPAITTPGYGVFVKDSKLNINFPSEEHGCVHLPKSSAPPQIGAKLEIYPNYVSDVVNLSDTLWVVQGENVIATWEIAARGKNV